MIAAWVIGGNGLLGSALQRALRYEGINLFIPGGKFQWGNASELEYQLRTAVKAFAAFASSAEIWHIYWAAGVGTMISTETDLIAETRTLSMVLNLITAERVLSEAKGSFIFSSSAGAIYANAPEEIISENTPISPASAYAHEKLKQENLLRPFAQNNPRVAVLLARISTLYGPGHNMCKAQGLIAHIARSVIQNKHINIYVPFDTIRDYITADDAATVMVATALAIDGIPGVYIKIIASERPTTIAEIISIFKRISRRKPKIVASSNRMSRIYKRRIQFRSNTILVGDRRPFTSLHVGIARVIAKERIVFARSRKKVPRFDPSHPPAKSAIK